jgi:soluble cytochrome b562
VDFQIIFNTNIKSIGAIDKHNKKKPKDIADCAQYNYGFKEFIKQLDQVKSTLQKEQTVENGE